ncbi:MAG: tetratricopeptide repeat protein [Actinophytocola sp.]|nr:tetratricopeptide repeat protein [Actinophytocola sp.]
MVQARDVSGGVHFHRWGRSSGPVPRQLPADVRGFVNRTSDLGLLEFALGSGGQKVDQISTLVVAGTAGVGKTSLAVHWAHQVVDRFPDGQLYANLRGYDPGTPVGPAEVLDRFLRAMGLSGDSIPAELDERAALYRSLLANRRFLVVLDNAATVGQVRPLLPGIAGCLVLVTSRSRLSGLVARDGAYRVTLDVLPLDDAVALLRNFTAEYRTGDPEEDLTDLARLCARLPIALRIAAERAVSRPRTPLRVLVAELRESNLWDALTAGDDDESAAVHTVFAWSYRALSRDASRTFRLLGLFPGPSFSPVAVAALSNEPVGKVRRVLDDLAGVHLLEQSLPERYQFHDLLRLYAVDQVHTEENADSISATTRRLFLWYLHTADGAVRVLAPESRARELPETTGDVPRSVLSDHREALDWFEAERDNLLSVVHRAREAEMDDIAWLLSATLREIYARYNYFDDWISTSSIGLESVRRLRDRSGEAEMLESLGKAYAQHADRDRGAELQSGALEIRRELGDLVGEATSTNALGLMHLRSRSLGEALRLFQRTNAIAIEISDEYWTAVSSNNIANVLVELERFDEARDLLGKALDGFRRLSVHGSAGDALRGLSHVCRSVGDYPRANEFIDAALSIARERKNPAWEAFWLLELGQVKMSLDDPAEALVAYQRAAVLQRRLGDRSREAVVFDATGAAYQRLGRHDEAIGFHRFAVATFRDLDERWHLAVALEHLGAALSGIEDAAESATCLREALTLLRAFDDPRARRDEQRIENALADRD